MKLHLLAAAAVLALSSPAYAGNDKPQSGGDSSANAGAAAGAIAGAAAVSGSSSNAVNTVLGSNNGGSVGNVAGGAGGQGGAGGRADASSSSTLGNLNSFGGSATAVNGPNTNLNTNTLGQAQGQQQAASSDQRQSQSTNSAVTNAGNSANTNTTSARTDNANNAAQSTNVNVAGDEAQKRNPVGMAYAAPVAFGQGTCGVSASAGGQGITGALSLAIPLPSPKCEVRYVVQTLSALGSATGDKTLFRAAELYYAKHTKGVSEAITDARAGK